MSKQKFNRKTFAIFLLAIVISFFLGNKSAYLQMYREEIARQELLSIAAANPLDSSNNYVDNTIDDYDTEDGDENDTVVNNDTADKYPANNNLINLNTAGKEDLMSLPAIGEVKAQAIIDYREKYGDFLSTEEIMNINGIGDKTYELLKDRICI